MLSLSAFTLWGISAILSAAGSWPWAAHELSAYCLPANVGTFFAYGLLAARWERLSTVRPTIAACAALALGALVFLAAWSGLASMQSLLPVAGILLGSGGALAFICWELTFATGSTHNARKAILLASVLSTIPYCALAFVPRTIMVPLLTVALVPACIALLLVAWRCIPCPAPLPAEDLPPRVQRYASLWSDTWAPLACTMMLGVVGPAIGSYASLEPMSDVLRTLLYQLANVAAVGVLALCWFKMRKRPTIESAFLVLAPIAVVALFLFPFWSHGYQGVVLAFGCFIFSLVSILMMVLCIQLSQRHRVGLGIVYGFFAAGTYLAQILGGFLGQVVAGSDYPRQFQVIAIIVLLLWGLSVIGLLAMWRMRLIARTAASDEPATADPVATRCAALSHAHGLTPRETEVLELIGRGRDANAIAEILCLSRNTVRTHIQRLYADLNVHTRQELIDLLEQTDIE